MKPGGPMGHTMHTGYQGWIDRCYLPFIVDIAVSIRPPASRGGDTCIALSDGQLIPVAHDLRSAVRREVQYGELLCLRMDAGVAVTVDFVDGRSPLVSAQLKVRGALLP